MTSSRSALRIDEAIYVPHNDVFNSFLDRWVQMLLGCLARNQICNPKPGLGFRVEAFDKHLPTIRTHTFAEGLML